LRLLEEDAGVPPGFEGVSANIRTPTGPISINADAVPPCDVRVFNEHFQEEYVGFRTARAEPIVVLGKDNLRLSQRITELELDLAAAETKAGSSASAVQQLPDLGSILRDTARTVSNELSGSPALRSTYHPRRYQAPRIRKLIESGRITEKTLSECVIEDPAEVASLREQLDTDLDEVEVRTRRITGIGALMAEVNRLLELVVDVPSIDRLDEDAELRRWVATGVTLHNSRIAGDCQYCTNPVPEDVASGYEAYFTQAVKLAEEQLVSTRQKLDAMLEASGVSLPDSSSLFSDLRGEYGSHTRKWEEVWPEIRSTIEEAGARLAQRAGAFQDSRSVQATVSIPKQLVADFNEVLERVHELSTRHNQRIAEGQSKAEEVGRRLERHLAARELQKASYFEKAKHDSTARSSAGEDAQTVRQIAQKLEELKAKRSDTKGACREINTLIELFMGEGEIQLQPVQTGEKTTEYHLLRRNKRTPHLSEGEKSVVSLAYFLTKLNESGADVSKSIVVLDDPVDSQDANFLYRTFALLRHRLGDAGQVFILTHNFEFFNLVRDWLGYDGVRDDARLFMMRSSPGEGTDGQVTYLEDLPRILSEFRTEYQYLMSLLIKYHHDQEAVEGPLVPNVARKVLEYFSSFKWSCPSSMTMASIINNHFLPDADHRKRGVGESVLKFVNEYSHGGRFDRPITASQFEAPAVAKLVLDFIRLADQDHFKLLKRQVARRA
jgi:wobble nucleotide-excising tRNase